MRFLSTCTAAIAVIFCTSSYVGTAIRAPVVDVSMRVKAASITAAPETIGDLRVRAPPKRRKYTRRPHSKLKCPIKHPKDCTNTELLKNGDFDKNVRGWEVFAGGLSQLFWVKDSRSRPAHSGAGQAYIFLNRGFVSMDFSTKLPAVEFGNSIKISMWMRYETPADISSCSADWTIRGHNGILPITLTPEWTKYTWEVPGFGREELLRFYISCSSLETPVSVYMDDVSAKACVLRKPDPECQVVKGADNLLVNPGFECPDGITAWQTQSNSFGSDSLVQYASQKQNPTHAGKGMAGFVYDNSQPPGSTGLAIYQWDIQGDLTRAFMKASFWLSVDSKFKDVSGCQLSVSTRTGYYLYGVDISYLTTKWTKFEIKEIVPDSLDDFSIDISWCSGATPPIIYIDDVYFGIDRSSPPAPSPTTTPTQPTPTTGPCNNFPSVVDPSMELDDNMNNWMQSNGDVMIYPDSEATYGPAHDGDTVAVVQLPPGLGSVSLTQYTSGFCPDTAYTASVWFYIPTGYDASLCQFRLGITGASDLFKVSSAGRWEKLEFAFFVDANDVNNPFETIQISAFCDNVNEMIVLVDDFRYGPAPACTVTPSIADGGFESGNVPNWDIGFFQGDETLAITGAKPRTGKKSAVLTFPSTSNGVSFMNQFEACVGTAYSFRVRYYVPKAHKGITCSISISAFFTGESVRETVSTYDSWVEAKLDFTAGGAGMTVVWSFICLNKLQKVVIYLDDVSVTAR